MASEPSIETKFCTEVNTALQTRNGPFLQSILVLEPPFSPIYEDLIQSLKKKFPSNSDNATANLENLIREGVPETHEGEDEEGRPVPSWGPMVSFLAGWMAFIRDVDPNNLLETYERLSDLQQKVNTALQHTTKGIIILPTVIAYAKVLSRVAIGIDKRPELIEALLSTTTTTTEEGHKESLPEKAANILRSAFITCLNDRATAPGGIKDGKPDGKKIGVYKTANICLKILFQCDNLDSCQTIFNNIQNSSPPLHIYPASERVTYLYYLGRYEFANTNFYSAQLCLQKAYDDSPTWPSCLRQRRLILIYLVASNILCGRFPTPHLYARPEARGLRDRFEPLTTSIRKGDLASFRRITHLNLSHPHAKWFTHYRMFYQLGNYCAIYLWRSIFRKVYLIEGGRQRELDAQNGALDSKTNNAAPTIDLFAVLAAFRFYEKRALMSPSMAQVDAGPGRRPISFLFSDFVTPAYGTGYVDPDFAGLDLEPYVRMPDIEEVEAMCGSLIVQGFLNGYISHRSERFAIVGAKRPGGALRNGFPRVWETVKRGSGEEVLGWKKEGGTKVGGVVRLKGARPAGS